MISSGTIRAFLAGFIIFWVDLLVTGIMVPSVQSFLLVLNVIGIDLIALLIFSTTMITLGITTFRRTLE